VSADNRPDSDALAARAQQLLHESVSLKRKLVEHTDLLARMAIIVADALEGDGKILLCGNGGSAADAQHLAAEFLVRLHAERNRRALPAIALHTDTSALTACANDYGYDQVFARMVEALGRRGDILLVLTTSGRSANVLRALERARAMEITTFGFLGGDGGPAAALCDLCVIVPSRDTGRIQEAHITLGHTLSDLVEERLFGTLAATPVAARAVTRTDLEHLFRDVGVGRGENVMVHSSLSSLGYVVNGAHDVIEALETCVGAEGTVLMPAHSGQLTEPADWRRPSLPAADWVDIVRANMRFFDPLTTRVRNRGVIAETFVSYPGVRRSSHPICSVAARGARAEEFTREHALHASEGPGSPAWQFWSADGLIVMIGLDLAYCSFLHLAEFLADVPYLKDTEMRVLVRGPGGERQFVKLDRYPRESYGFNKLRPALEAEGAITSVAINGGHVIAFRLRRAIDVALARLREDPYYFLNAP